MGVCCKETAVHTSVTAVVYTGIAECVIAYAGGGPRHGWVVKPLLSVWDVPCSVSM